MYKEPLKAPIGQEKIWAQLQNKAKQKQHLANLLQQPQRCQQYQLEAAGLFFDFSKQLINNESRDLLIALADNAKLDQHKSNLVNGLYQNITERRAVVHTALRTQNNKPILVKGENIVPIIAKERQKMFDFVDQFQAGLLRGVNGDTLDTIINIGIGGSDLGPKMLTTALATAEQCNKVHFISNVDGACINRLLATVDLTKCLIIIQSKSFSTIETLTNAQTILEQLNSRCQGQKAAMQQVVAVTANHDKAVAFGIPVKQIFAFWDWVGGRYSLWSSIGLPIALAIGKQQFKQLLAGAYAMDQHFLNTPTAANLPKMAALVGIWNRNFLQYKDYALIPYAEDLTHLPAYIQQLDMESNGKSVSIDNQLLDYATGPVVWGTTGTNGQHAFFQLLHQGISTTPIDFIGIIANDHSIDNHHHILNANMVAQSIALAIGSGKSVQNPYQYYAGNRPSSTILLNKLDAFHLGSLIAFFELKVFVQGVIWQINSFDQWGVELGKKISESLTTSQTNGIDPCSAKLLQKLQLHH